MNSVLNIESYHFANWHLHKTLTTHGCMQCIHSTLQQQMFLGSQRPQMQLLKTPEERSPPRHGPILWCWLDLHGQHLQLTEERQLGLTATLLQNTLPTFLSLIMCIYLHSFLWQTTKTHTFWNRVCSRSLKVIDFGTNRKHICYFLLVPQSNLGPILPHFRDIAGFLLGKWP